MKAEVNERESFEQVTGRFPELDEPARQRAADRMAAGDIDHQPLAARPRGRLGARPRRA